MGREGWSICYNERHGKSAWRRIPDESLPRIIADGKAFPLTGDGPWIIGRKNDFDQQADIPVSETSTNKNYISRKHIEISKVADGVFVLKNVGLNKVMVKNQNRWIETNKNSVQTRRKAR